MTFTREFFAFANSDLVLYLKKSYFMVCLLLFIVPRNGILVRISIHYRGQGKVYLQPSRISMIELFLAKIV